MFKNFLMKKMIQRQGASPEQAEMIVKVMEKNPALFQQIAEEIQVKVKSGQDQQAAALAVMMAHQAELQKLMTDK